MSLTGQRQEIADALSTVEGVTGFKYRPTGLNTGMAWPLLDVLTSQRRDYEATWHVLVVLPPDEQKASEWFDDKYEAIADALTNEFGSIEQIYPEGLRTSEGDIQVMRLIVRREG
jgi:hypothetical protein